MEDKQLVTRMENALEKIEKLEPLLNAIESVQTRDDGSLYVKFKAHLIIENDGNQIFFSKKGQTVIQANRLHLNPGIDPTRNTQIVEEELNEVIAENLEDAKQKLIDNQQKCDCGGECS